MLKYKQGAEVTEKLAIFAPYINFDLTTMDEKAERLSMPLFVALAVLRWFFIC